MSKNNTINYQQIYEDEVNQTTLDSLEWSNKWFELSNHHRMLIQDLIDLGYSRAVEDALDPEVMTETAELSIDMAAQLQSFADILRAYTTLATDHPQTYNTPPHLSR